jgi:hypothetical protein
MLVHAEQRTSDDGQSPPGRAVPTNWKLTPHRRKETLLPRITQLALEGHSGETIGHMLGMPSRTVRRWLHELRQEWIAARARGAAEMFAVARARLTAVYREAMEQWRYPQRDIEVRPVENTQVADGNRPAKQKKSVRPQPQRRNTALLAKATAAAKAMFDLNLRVLAAPARTAGPSGGSTPAETPTQEDSPHATDAGGVKAFAAAEPDSGHPSV